MRFKTAISKWLLVGVVRAESGHSYDIPLLPHMLLKFFGSKCIFSLYFFTQKGHFSLFLLFFMCRYFSFVFIVFSFYFPGGLQCGLFSF